MTMGPPEMERKLRQLDNDVQSIYDILGSIQATQQRHGSRFDGIDRRFDGIEGRFDGIDRRFDGIEGRLDEIDGRFDGIDGRFDGIDRRITDIDGRFDTLDATLNTVVDLLQAGPPRGA